MTVHHSVSEWSTDYGLILVIGEHGYCPVRSWIATKQRSIRWLLAILKQATCWHQWTFNAEAMMHLSLQDAKRWGVFLYGYQGTAVRTNFICRRCGKFSHRYRPNWQVGLIPKEQELGRSD